MGRAGRDRWRWLRSMGNKILVKDWFFSFISADINMRRKKKIIGRQIP